MEILNGKEKSDTYRTLKVLTMILVVAGHCAIMYSVNGAITPRIGSSSLAVLTAVIYQFHMPTFFMVSGAIFSLCIGKGKYSEFMPFLKNKTLRLIVPYFLFGLFYVGPVLYFCGLLSVSYLKFCFFGILLAQNARHLWYLLTLFLIFLIAWPLKSLCRSRYCPLLFATSLVISVVSAYLPLHVLGYFQLGNALFYQFFFFCGVFLHRYFQPFVSFFLQRKYVLIFSVLLFFARFIFNPNIVSSLFYTLCGMVTLTWVSAWLSCNRQDFLKTKLFRVIDENTYGIYLFHPMLVYLIFYATLSYAINPFLLSATAFLVTFVLSVLLTKLCRVMKLGFLIGEFNGGKHHGGI